MRKFTKKQYLAAGVAAVVIAGGAGAAFAYWSTSGSGTGSASTSAGNNAAVSISDDSKNLTALYPGDSAQTITVTLKNSDTAQSVHVNGATAWLTVVPAGTGSCDASDYKLGGAVGADQGHPISLSNVATELAQGASETTTTSLQFNDKNVAQDGCKGAAVTINYASS